MVLIVGCFWFLSSALLSTWANTTFLKTFKDAVLHTLVRFFGSAILGGLTLISTGEVKLVEIPILIFKVAIPAVLLWLANYANSVALEKTGITLTYVMKACIPVFTVITCRLQGQKFAPLIYVSLLPICLGVALASASDMDFDAAGLAAALTSALAQTFMNISIKSVRVSTGYSGPKAFLGMTIVCEWDQIDLRGISLQSSLAFIHLPVHPPLHHRSISHSHTFLLKG